jgi:hypothetical protein
VNAIVQLTSSEKLSPTHKLGIAWGLLCAVFAIHTLDESLTGFLGVYNPTVIALRQQLGYWPMPTLSFAEYLRVSIVMLLVGLMGSPFVFCGYRWIRPVVYISAIMMLLNGLGHTLFTILGHTVGSVRFPRPAPGFYSSPLLLIVSIYTLVQLRRTRRV